MEDNLKNLGPNPLAEVNSAEAAAKEDAQQGNGAKEKRDTTLWLFGEIEGGTKYYSHENMVGAYRLEKEYYAMGKAPDAIFYSGELPEQPPYITRGGRDKEMALGVHVQDLDHGIVGVKPDLSRIINLAVKMNKNCYIGCVVNENDKGNMTRETDQIIATYNRNPARIVEAIQANIWFLEGQSKILKTLQETRQKDIKTNNRSARAERVQKKITQFEKSIADYELIVDKQIELLRLWFDERVDVGLGIYDNARTILWTLNKFDGVKDNPIFLMALSEKLSNVRLPNIRDMLENRNKMDTLKKNYGEVSDTLLEMLEMKGSRSVRGEEKEDMIGDLFSHLVENSKSLADNIIKQGHVERVNVERKMARDSMDGVAGAIMIFVNQLAGSKELCELASTIGKYSVIAGKRDTSGREYSINVLPPNLNLVDINGLKVLISHKPSEYTSTFIKNNNSGVDREISRAKDKIDLYLFQHSFNCEVWITPLKTRSEHNVYVFGAPPFVDVDKVEQTHKEGIKTPFIKQWAKGPITSGFLEIHHDGTAFDYNFYSSEYLKLLSNKEKEEQLKVLMAKIEAFSKDRDAAINRLKLGFECEKVEKALLGGAAPFIPIPHMKGLELGRTLESRIADLGVRRLDIDHRDRLQINAKLPSELNDNLLEKMLVDAGIDPGNAGQVRNLLERMSAKARESDSDSPETKAFLERVIPQAIEDTKLEKITHVILSDVHVGSPGQGTPTLMILEGMQKFLQENGYGKEGKPFVLELGGDNLEGNLRDHKNELNTESGVVNKLNFSEMLEKKGIRKGSEEYEREMNRYAEWLFSKQAMHRPDEQAEVFVRKARWLLDNADHIVIIAGNHMNRTLSDKSMDESQKLGMLIEQFIPKERVTRVPGGEFGLEHVQINGRKYLFQHKPPDSQTAIEKTRIEGTSISGDKHVYHLGIFGNKVFITSPQLQGFSTFPEQVGFPVNDGGRGISIHDLYYHGDKQDPVIVHGRPVLLRELRDRKIVEEISKNIKEFENSLRTGETKTERIELYKKTKA
jgi:hypothetical protein